MYDKAQSVIIRVHNKMRQPARYPQSLYSGSKPGLLNFYNTRVIAASVQQWFCATRLSSSSQQTENALAIEKTSLVRKNRNHRSALGVAAAALIIRRAILKSAGSGIF